VYVGYLDAKKTISVFELPIQLGAGWKTKQSVYDVEKNGNLQWTYVGAAGSQTAPTTILPTVTRYPYDPKSGGNVSALGLPLPDVYTTLDQFEANSEWFVPSMPNNHINEFYSSRAVKEQIDAAYVEGNTRLRALRLNLGLRHERTRTVAKIQNVTPSAVVQREGFTPNTPAFIDRQYNFGQRESRYGNYDNNFLSGGAKWAFNRNLHAQVAASQSIGRPGYNNLAGQITVNETNMTVRVPNPELKPETSDKYFAGLQYYLEPAGTISVSGFRLFVENMAEDNQPVTAEEAG
jgi:hypothetical protein